MNKQPTTIRTYLLRGAFLLSLAFIIVIPLALGQTRSRESKPSMAAAQMPQVASLAHSAQPGQPGLSTATATHGKAPVAATAALSGHPVVPNSVYMIDDGVAEDAVGFGDGTQNFESIWFNQFTVIPGQTTITTVSVAWGFSGVPQPIDGEAVTIGIWSDPNGDGNPSDAVLLGSVAGTIQNANTNTFVDYTLSPPVTLPGGATSFFVGDMTPAHPGFQVFQQSIDESSTHRQSWVAAMSSGAPVDFTHLGNNDFIGIIDDFGISGNWMIRADTGSSTPTPTPTPTATPTPPPNALWYNGDFDNVDGLTNEENTFATGFSHIYDDFNVTDSPGWDVTSVFSDNLASTNITSATWEIRQGVSAGNGGTLIASGMTVTPVVTPTGRSGFGFTEFMVEVTGLSVHLAPGTYWLNVTPVDNLDGGRSFDSTTSGANCVGMPCGNDSMAFLDSTLFGAVFEPTGDFCTGCDDFSMGVNGSVSGGTPTPTPTPGQIVLTASTRRVNGDKVVRLNWTGATSRKVDIYRNDASLARVPNSGFYTDVLTVHGSYTYKVCEKGTMNCSNEVTVRFGAGE